MIPKSERLSTKDTYNNGPQVMPSWLKWPALGQANGAGVGLCRVLMRQHGGIWTRQQEAADLLTADQTVPQSRIDFFQSILSAEGFHHVGWEGAVVNVIVAPGMVSGSNFMCDRQWLRTPDVSPSRPARIARPGALTTAAACRWRRPSLAVVSMA